MKQPTIDCEMKDRLGIFSNTEEIVENTMRSGVFLISFKVFGNEIKYCPECVIYRLN